MQLGFLAIAGDYNLTSGSAWQNIKEGHSVRYLWLEPTADVIVKKTSGGNYTRICGGSSGWETLFEITGMDFAIPNTIWKPQYDAGNTIVFRETK